VWNKRHVPDHGRYDLVCVVEGPNDETVARPVLTSARKEMFQTETLKAWTEDEFRRITDSI
jgi:uncharacterized protein with GYD domain